ncbi:hypothetical protein QN277_011998 [Acacia crassicarpa]|uniref:Endonuclease/exonuclease/phosphatase domain-containing protein n=1 Tax=Acacia crassicarpa TaxID=499986 RepID=A0AAE1TCD8_9FABA|nr:hypothetical protein QN277_011998 [Acacia crassicarpa]
MKLLAWNCQGPGRALTVKNLRDLVKQFRPSIIFLFETKMYSSKVRRISRKCGFTQGLYVEPLGLAGGLVLGWKEDVDMVVLYKSINIIHVEVVSSSTKLPRFITFVYYPPKERERRIVWDAMRSVGAGLHDSWLAVGDFNDLLSQAEKEGGTPRTVWKIMNFQSMASDCNLMDLEFKGLRFTWCNNRLGAMVRERLDRAFGNVEFRNEFDHALVFNVEPVGSDHHALIIDSCFSEEKFPKYFKFEASWAQHEDFLKIVGEGWNDVEGNLDNRINDLIRRLAACQKRLVRWNSTKFPNFKKVIEQLRHKLHICYEGHVTDASLKEAEGLVKQLEETWDREESYWWQRSRIAWLNRGDCNTKFFHSCVI